MHYYQFNVMIKYIILSVIGYYIFINYLSPMIEGHKKSHSSENEQQRNNKHDSEYVDYEEID